MSRLWTQTCIRLTPNIDHAPHSCLAACVRVSLSVSYCVFITKKRKISKRFSKSELLLLLQLLLSLFPALCFSFSFSFNQLSMASVPLSSVCFSQTPKSLCFSFVASDNLGFSSSTSSLRFLTPKKNRTRIRVSVCRAASPSLVFRNLDADDFRHPLDKQV